MNSTLINQLLSLQGINASEALMPLAKRIAESAKSKAPVAEGYPNSGYLRDHIVASEIENGVQIESQAGYSLFVEFGTVNMAAEPFLRPAIDEQSRNLDDVVADINKQLEGLV